MYAAIISIHITLIGSSHYFRIFEVGYIFKGIISYLRRTISQKYLKLLLNVCKA
jgi:hypothetical protein